MYAAELTLRFSMSGNVKPFICSHKSMERVKEHVLSWLQEIHKTYHFMDDDIEITIKYYRASD